MEARKEKWRVRRKTSTSAVPDTTSRILQRQQFTLLPQELSVLPSEEQLCPQEA